MMTFKIITHPKRREAVPSQVELFLLHATVDRNFVIVAIDVHDAILLTTRRSGHMNMTKNGNMVRRAST
jgi:hypothetical protein